MKSLMLAGSCCTRNDGAFQHNEIEHPHKTHEVWENVKKVIFMNALKATFGNIKFNKAYPLPELAKEI